MDITTDMIRSYKMHEGWTGQEAYVRKAFKLTEDYDWEANHKYTLEHIPNSVCEGCNPLQSVRGQLKSNG